MTAIHFLIPGDPESRTGGYLYAKRMIAGLRDAGWSVTLARLADSFPIPDGAALAHAENALARIPDNSVVVIDGLALGAMPEIAHRHAGRLRSIGLVHHPLAEETGLPDDLRARLFASERAALAAVCHVIVSSPFTADLLVDYGVEAGRLGIVEPGTDPATLAVGSGGDAVAMVSVGTLTPRKGHLVLIEALAGLTDHAWHLTCAGSADRDPVTAHAVHAAVEKFELADRVTFLGEIGARDLDRVYAASDLFVFPSYFEGYGMALTEALARGLPIVSTTGGAIPRTVPAEAAVLVPPGDAAALCAAIDGVLRDAGQRARLAAAARAVRGRLPTWPTAVQKFAAQLTAVARA